MLATDLDILYVDNHLLVLNKSAGITTQEDHFAETSLEAIGKSWVKETYNKPGNVFLHPVHRLDKPVSGIVLFARTSKALSRLNLLMREKNIKKTYVAITANYPPAKSATLEHYLVHEEHYARIASSNEPNAKLAILHYQVLQKKEGKSFVQIDLQTGRYHQIRAQLAAIGCPILGDKRYGAIELYKPFSIALAHVRMQFKHPVTDEDLDFNIPSPFAL